MLPRGRPPGPGTAEEKAAIRREKVRLNVKAYRERKKNALAAASTKSTSVSHASNSSVIDSSSTLNKINSHVQHKGQDCNGERTCQVACSTAQAVSKMSKPYSRPGDESCGGQSLWLAPSNGPIFLDSFLSVCRNNLLPTDVYLPVKDNGHSELITPCSPWIMSAYRLATQQDGGALRSGLVAIGLMLSRLPNNSNDLKVISLQMQRKAISQLRTDIEPTLLQRSRKRSATSIIAPYLSCLAVTMFELIDVGFSSGILTHITALNSLIGLVYSDPNVDKFMADLIMEDFGMLEMTFYLRFGCTSLLQNTRRKLRSAENRRGASDGFRRNASVYGDLLDIVEDLTLLIAQVEDLQSIIPPHCPCDKLQHCIRKLLKMQRDIDAWKIDFEVRHGSIISQKNSSRASPGKSVTIRGLRSYEHGGVALFMLSFLLHALNASIEAMTLLSQVHRGQITTIASVQEGDLFRQVGPTSKTNTPQIPNSDAPDTMPCEATLAAEMRKLLDERLEAQRARARLTVMQVIEVSGFYVDIATSISGRSLLVGPCHIATLMLEKESTKLHEELRQVDPSNHEAAMKTNKHLEEVAEARRLFKAVEQRL